MLFRSELNGLRAIQGLNALTGAGARMRGNIRRHALLTAVLRLRVSQCRFLSTSPRAETVVVSIAGCERLPPYDDAGVEAKRYPGAKASGSIRCDSEESSTCPTRSDIDSVTRAFC